MMPKEQLHATLNRELGDGWETNFIEFEDVPIAAASIGQVHRGKLHDNTSVAMKVQYPGVANSIDSDVANLKRLLKFTQLIPPGLFIEHALEVARDELREECNYTLEAERQDTLRRFVNSATWSTHPFYPHPQPFFVPRVISQLSTSHVLTTELAPGYSIDKAKHLDQTSRDYICYRLLELTLKQLFVFR